MFDDEDTKKQPTEFPRNLDTLSIDDLQDYVTDLKAEITRTEAEITRKQASTTAADSFFKS